MSEVRTRTPTPDQAYESHGGSKGTWLIGIALAFGAGVWLWTSAQHNDRANAELRERVAQRQADRDRVRQEIILVPQAGISTPPPAGAVGSDVTATAPIVVASSAPPVVQPTPPSFILMHQEQTPDNRERVQQEMFWRDRAMRIEARLAAAAAAYVGAVCKERLAGIPVAGSTTYNQYRNEYVQAIVEAEAIQEAGRRAAADPGWFAIRTTYPPPLGQDVMPSVVSSAELSAYKCGSH